MDDRVALDGCAAFQDKGEGFLRRNSRRQQSEPDLVLAWRDLAAGQLEARERIL